ncbi:hypothetical protein [Methylotenera sp. G11]|uniref:hypothetical protein n=1 Tax=Methylotenera sp. G11 TaxID=1506585 RepID=UPI001362F39E|nr:hypothetical protein [Methylotenera sp. G11]
MEIFNRIRSINRVLGRRILCVHTTDLLAYWSPDKKTSLEALALRNSTRKD